MFQHTANTLEKGAVGLARAIYEYQKRGYTVCVPLVDAQDYDLVIGKRGVFWSVQCKTTTRLARKRHSGGTKPGCYEVGLRSIKVNTKKTRIKYRGEYDLLFVLCENGDCYSIPSQHLPMSGIEVGGPKYAQFLL